MGEQYFTKDPTSESREAVATWEHGGKTVEFVTDRGVFSRGHVDFGSRLLVASLPPLHGRVLDLGCGYGFVGVAVGLTHPGVAELVLCDVNARALALARRNAARHGVAVTCLESDGFAAVEGTFDAILTNPPVRAGKAVYYPWFAEAARRLRPGGALYLVLQRKQGAPSAQKHLEGLFADVTVLERDAGYHILRAADPRTEV